MRYLINLYLERDAIQKKIGKKWNFSQISPHPTPPVCVLGGTLQGFKVTRPKTGKKIFHMQVLGSFGPKFGKHWPSNFFPKFALLDILEICEILSFGQQNILKII